MINFLYQFVMLASGILVYEFYGLIMSMMAMIAISTLFIISQKVLKKPIEPLVLIQYVFLFAFGLPAYFLHDPFWVKLQEGISGLLMGVGFLAASYFYKSPLIKGLIPKFVKDFFENPNAGSIRQIANRYLIKTPDAIWKKIDYLWGIEMTLSAAASLVVALTFSTQVWFYGKYLIGPVLSLIAFSIQCVFIYNAGKNAPVPDVTPENEVYFQPEEIVTVNQSSGLIYSNIFDIAEDYDQTKQHEGLSHHHVQANAALTTEPDANNSAILFDRI